MLSRITTTEKLNYDFRKLKCKKKVWKEAKEKTSEERYEEYSEVTMKSQFIDNQSSPKKEQNKQMKILFQEILS